MYKKTIVLSLALLLIGSLYAQEKRTIKVIVPNNTDEVYITGNQESLGNWNPKGIKMEKLSDYERSLTVELNYPAEFKFTKGDWDSEGITHQLDDNPNSIIQNSAAKNIFVIRGWANESNADGIVANFTVKQLESEYLKGGRSIKIALPNNYDSNKKYPVFYATDGGWNLFSVTKKYTSVASLDEYSLIPESIVVGIVHGETDGQSNRNEDLDVYYKKSGKSFKNFVFKELVPYINKTYSTSGFNVMVGHSNGAQYNHYLLLEEDNPFRGFISLSTNFYGVDFRQEIGEKMKTHDGKKIYYFVANATVDSPDRIEAGNDYEKIYNANKNSKFQFKKTTYTANHNSVVPVALLDGIQFVFKDYQKFDTYSTIASYKDNYIKDMKNNYGIDEAYSIWDLDGIYEKIMANKDREELEDYFQFIEDEKLWQNPAMNGPGGLDAANKGNIYFFAEDYKKSAKSYRLALDELNITVESMVYFGNLSKGVKSFYKIKDYQGLMQLLLKSRDYLVEQPDELSERYTKSHLLKLHYEIAKLSNEQNINPKEGKKALTYCMDNYKKNKMFTKEELEALQ